MNETELPWYTTLLGGDPEAEEFRHLCAEFNLSCKGARRARNRWYENDQLGISVSVDQGKIDTVQLFSAEHPYFAGFRDKLPLGLDFGMKRDSVHKKLGNPEHVTPARYVSPDLAHSGIDRYYTRSCAIAVTYSHISGRIEVLSFERL